jgi:aspartyl protease family protein
MRGALIPLAIVALVTLGLTILFPERLRGAGGEGAQLALLQSAMLAVLVGTGLFGAGKADRGDTGRRRLLFALVWIGVFVFLVAAHSQRDAFARLFSGVTGAFVPAAPQMGEGGAVTLRKASDGHFWAQVRIDGQSVRAMVDTGATMVALDPADARAVGIDVESLRHDIPVSTAGGREMAARVRLERVMLGPLVAEDVEALVMRRPTGVTLLGMSFLSRFSEVRVRGDEMSVTP